MSVIVFGDYLPWIQANSPGGGPVERVISFGVFNKERLIGAACIYDWVEGDYAYLGAASTTPLWCSRRAVLTAASIIYGGFKCKRTLAVTYDNNLPARRFLEKAGFALAGEETYSQEPANRLTYVLTESAGAALIERMRAR
jgi:RimJ/RimL family protein N-acetyltransferase